MDVELPKPQGKMAETIEEAARDVAKCLNERNGNGLDLRHVAMLVYHAQQGQSGMKIMNDLTNWYRDAFYKLEPLRWHLGELTEAARIANNLAPYTVIPLHKVAAAEDVNNKADEFFCR